MFLKKIINKIFTNDKIKFSILIITFFSLIIFGITLFKGTYSKINNIDNSIENLSRVEGTTVYVDNRLSDLYYYNSLNYTESSTGTLPTGIDQNIYNNSNMVQVTITYSGIDTIHNNLRGTVSTTENYDTYIYYDWYPVRNGKVVIPLIDNPFTKRPIGKGFNGWISDDTGVNVYLDIDTYERFAEITPTSSGSGYTNLNLSFFASWINANEENTSEGWNAVFDAFETAGLHQTETTEEVCVTPALADVIMDGYYLRQTAPRNTTYSGYYVSNYQIREANNRNCTNYGGCTYYTLIEDGSHYTNGTTYYRINNNGNNFTTVNTNYILEQATVCHDEYLFSNTDIMAGYYTSTTVARNESLDGYYDINGNLQSGTCNTNGGCNNYYKYLDKYDSNGNINYFDASKTYYYNVTRDLNIAHLNSTNLTSNWTGNKPFTFTGILEDGTQSTNRWTPNGNVTLRNDTVIENMTINGNTGYSYSDLTNTRVITAKYYNLKIGRGIKKYQDYYGNENVNFNGVVGGNSSTGSSSSDTRYKIIVESGYYNNTSVTESNTRAYYNDNLYIDGQLVFGNDLDRITNNNDNLEVYYEATASWAGNIRSSKEVAVTQIVKSGRFGTSKHDIYTGIYVGGVLNGTYYSARSVRVEGGWIYNLIGGPLTATNRRTVNDTYIYMTGGTVDLIFGGAGSASTYGNRIISVTGGQVTYSILGGSNGNLSSSTDGAGTVYGSSLIYVGGNAVIGDDTLTNDNRSLFGVEYGNVFGNGNGKTGYLRISSNDNSHVIIDGNCTIKNSVYGGGNYSATGIYNNNSSAETKITVLGGNINGDVYGGGNQNKPEDYSISNNVTINMSGGHVNGNIYGGSNVSGVITGNTNVNVTGGTITGNVYGGGKGSNTFVKRNSNVTIGTLNNTGPTINSVYGGSAFGTVNNTSASSTLSSYNTLVVVNSGTVTNVFGGGQGDNNNTPYVCGNVTVDVNGGIVENAFGANDLKGTPNGIVTLNVNGGTVTNAYAGGNQTEVNSPYINLLGGTITNAFGGGNSARVVTSNVLVNGANVSNVFGGSNASGDVTTGNVVINSGTVGSTYGGNNIGGTTATSYVTTHGGTITNVYGGGNSAAVNLSNVNIAGGTITSVYGGGNSAGVTTTNVDVDSGTITSVFGGSNSSGNVTTSNVIIDGGTVTNVFGGNNVGGTTATTNVTTNGGTITNVYGGGEQTNVTTTANVNINSAVTNVFGGSDSNGTVANTIVNINTGSDVDTVYGGNNLGGTTTISHVNVVNGTADEVYGGGLQASTGTTNILLNGGTSVNVYGGGNEGNVTGNTNVTVTNSTVSNSVYGGGNNASVLANTSVIVNSGSSCGNVFGGGNNGMVIQNATTTISNSSITGSAYAGGNGSTAIVIGNNKINVEGTTTVGSHVFGGGNAAATGCENNILNSSNEVIYTCSSPNTSSSEVNIAGGVIGGNVYGGANTSVVYGETNVNIGINTITDNLTSGNINIAGTVFGGGEANASGSEDYDFSFISVTEGININIDASDHNTYLISGSIFGSGNASSSGGYSYINIKNYGTLNNPKRNISIQRTDIVTLDNSSMLLSGAQDRTNKYKSELFTLSRIGELKLKNNSSLYLEKGANLLEKFSSLVDVNNVEEEASVQINNGVVTKNVDNRLYMFEGKNLNISDDESLATFGIVEGMTFFGMFKIDRNGNVATGLYSNSYHEGETVSGSELYYFSSGSYVVGKHKSNHDIYADGFYSHFRNEEGTGITVDYIEPTPSDATFYRWVIGESVETLEVNITASKYSTLGTSELQLMDYYQPNTEIYILGVNYDNLNSDINLLPNDDIPRYANNSTDANTNFGLAMKTGTIGWITRGATEFSTNDPLVSGNTYYKAENSNAIPSFIFYLYHSKNITETKNLGTATISLMVVTPIDDLSNQIQRINIDVTMNSAFYEGNNYEASIAPGAQYELFANTNVNITNKSTFSTYFSLYSTSSTTIYRPGYARYLVTNYAYPVNTKITMIDFASSGQPEYYYFIIDTATYNNSVIALANDNEISYPLSNFIRMGSSSTSNTYDDATANNNYYDSTLQKAEEEFIFIVDFKDTEINADVLNKTLLLELRDSATNNPIIPVLDISAQKMFFNLYNNKEGILSSTANLSNNTLYIGQNVDLNVTTTFSQQKLGNVTIIDTNYYDKRLGIKLSLYDSNNELVNGATLLGIAFVYNGIRYYPRQDGTVRFNIAESVANVSSRIKIDAEKSNIPSGSYVLKIETFGSADGIYYGVDTTSTIQKNITIVNETFGLDASTANEDVIIDKDTGLSQDKNDYISYQVSYQSGLSNPNIRASLYRRTYTDVYDYTYQLVDLQDYVTNELSTTNEEKVYLIRNLPTSRFQVIFNMQESLVTGTYQVRFSLYDGDNYVGHINKYIIIE